MTDSSMSNFHPKFSLSRWVFRSTRVVVGTGGASALVLASGCLLAASADAMWTSGGRTASKLGTSYRSSQPTGWEQPYTPTLGGHVGFKEISYNGKKYRITALPFGQPAKSPDPVYEAVPNDPDVNFKQTLARAWSRYYTFRYLKGLPGGAKFVVESYSVALSKQSVISGAGQTSSGLGFGEDIYFVYKPGKSRKHPAINSDLQFIEVVYGHGASFVDSTRHNPFYGEGGGLTSIDGNQIVNFDDFIQSATGKPQAPTVTSRAETFLAQDTGQKNSAGKEIVNIYGGVKWGFELEPVK